MDRPAGSPEHHSPSAKSGDTPHTDNNRFDASRVQPDASISNVESRLGAILMTHYPNFKNNPEGFLSKPSILWFVRKDMEGARYYYSCGQQGFRGFGRCCESGAALEDPRYQALKEKMEEAERKVIEMENAKGYTFVGVRDDMSSIIFKDSQTGKELSVKESGSI